MAESLKAFFLKLLSGRLGLATTFWLYGVLVALILNFLISHVTALWQVTLLTLVAFAHFVLIVIAVWNASKLYQGKQIWKWLARIVALLNFAKWLWHLPLLIATVSSAMGFKIYSDEYWELNWAKFDCEPAEYRNTPEMLVKKYSCKISANPNGELLAMRCQGGENVRDYIFTKSQENCKKYLKKVEHLRKKP